MKFLKYIVFFSLMSIFSCVEKQTPVEEEKPNVQLKEENFRISTGKVGPMNVGDVIAKLQIPYIQSLTSSTIYIDNIRFRVEWLLNEGSQELVKIIPEHDANPYDKNQHIREFYVLSPKYFTKDNIKVGSAFSEIQSLQKDYQCRINMVDRYVYVYFDDEPRVQFIFNISTFKGSLSFPESSVNSALSSDQILPSAKVERIRVF